MTAQTPDAQTVQQAFDRASEYFSRTLGAALDDAHRLREAVRVQVAAMQDVLDVTPDDVPLTTFQGRDLERVMERAVLALGKLVSLQEHAMDETVAECRRIKQETP